VGKDSVCIMLDVKDYWVLGKDDCLLFISLVEIKIKRWHYVLQYFVIKMVVLLCFFIDVILVYSVEMGTFSCAA
jgi:hypothetical protein